MSRKIILNLAMSLDGFIADKNGGYEWIVGAGDDKLDTARDFSFPEFLDHVDLIVMGRKSYEDCPLDSFASQKIIVATSQEKTNYENVEFTNKDIVSTIQNLQKEEGKDIWLFGGSVLADAFLKADIVDEYIIGIVPIILGSGIRLFNDDNPSIPLHLDDCTLREGLPILRYSKR